MQISLPVILSFVTLIAVVAIAVFQLRRVQHSQEKRGETTTGLGGDKPL